jgi:hypothetical protein
MFDYNYFFEFWFVILIDCCLNLWQISQTYFNACFHYWSPYWSFIHSIYLTLSSLCFSIMFCITIENLILILICSPISSVYPIFLINLMIMTIYFCSFHFVFYFQWIGFVLHYVNHSNYFFVLFDCSNHLHSFCFLMKKRTHDFIINFSI